MHQEHNIPWNLLASNFKFIRDDPHYTPRPTGIFARQLPGQAKSLNHFKRVLHNTITTFSETERQKYNATPLPTYGSTLPYGPGLHQWFEFNAVVALHAYVGINFWAAMGLLEGGEYLETRGCLNMVKNETASTEFVGHGVPPRTYLNSLPKDEATGLPILYQDLEGLKEYLKMNFQLLYRLDMLMKECGIDPQWEKKIVGMFRRTRATEFGVGEDGEYGEHFVCFKKYRLLV